MTVMPSKHSTCTTTVSVRVTVIGTFHIFIFMLYRYRYTVVCLYNIVSNVVAHGKEERPKYGKRIRQEDGRAKAMIHPIHARRCLND